MNDPSSQRARYQFLLSSAAFALAAVVLCRMFLLDGRSSSDVIATHWNRAGEVDGAGKVTELLLVLSLMAGAPAGVVVALVAFRAPLRRGSMLLSALTGFTTFLGTLAVCVSWSVAALNQGVTHYQEAAPMRGTHVALVVALPLLSGAGAARAARFLWPTSGREAALDPSLHLAPGEREIWLGWASSSAWLWIGLPLCLALAWAFVVGRAGPLPVVLLAVVALVIDAFSVLRVTVDRRGLSIRYGHLGLVHQSISLEKVDSARALDIRPMDHGGWGYRGSLFLLGKAALVVRRGEGIEVTLRAGRKFLVTVDDAQTGAALLNGLVEQQSKAENERARSDDK